MRRVPIAVYSIRLFALLAVFSALRVEVALGAAESSIEGRVTDQATGQPVVAARVSIGISGTQGSLEAASDARGEFRFPQVASGDYRLRVEAPGYLPVEYDLALKPRQPLSLAVELHSSRTPAQFAEVRATFVGLDPAQTGSSRLLTRRGLEALPSSATRDVQTLAEILAPGAILSHDNFVHVRGNELSLHEFINGVAFLDNPHAHFTSGASPQIFDSVNLVTGGFPAEFGNRFGGVLDITTRSGRTLDGHGSASVAVGTALHHDARAEYGGKAGRLGYYFFAGGFESGRFLNPVTPAELHDLGYGLRSAAQLDYQGEKNTWKLLMLGDGTHFQLPDTAEEFLLGRDALRRVSTETAILTWQRIFSPRALLSTSAYEREVSDRLVPTSDPETPWGEGSRSTLTTGFKSDLTLARAGHTVKTGIDLTLFRLRESFSFDPRDDHEEPEEHSGHLELPAFFFRGRDRGGQVSLYVQDRFSPFRHFTVDAGARWDRINLVSSEGQVSPRLGLAYHLPRTRSVFHFTYNRFFTPPPLEYVILSGFLGSTHALEEGIGGNVRPYTQNYFEAGWNQELEPNLFLEVNAYTHRGRNSFENSEISNTRLFVPTNFDRARARGAEVSLTLRHLERAGVSARFQYAAGRVAFFGPVSGGFPAEDLAPGERILPAFDQTHTASANVFYRRRWRNLRSGVILRYGSGTAVGEHSEASTHFHHLPQHLTADLSSGVTLWQKEPQRLDLEWSITNVSNSIYSISKESETTPIQFAPRRVVIGRLTWHF